MDAKAKTDRSEDWELESKFEAEGDSVPCISFPKMHEVIEDSDSMSYRTCAESNKKSEELLSQHVCESEMERKGEDKLEQLSPHEQHEKSEKLRRDADEALKDKCFHCKQKQEYKKGGSEKYEVMEVECLYELSKDRVRREAWENLQGVIQNEHENNINKKKALEALQDVSLNEQETDKAKRKMLKALQDLSQNGQENNMIRKEIEEVLQDLSKIELENTRIKREVLEVLQDVSRIEQEINRARRKAEKALLKVLIKKIMQDNQKEQENDRAKSEMLGAHQDASQKEQENDGAQSEMLEALQDVPQNKQENDRNRTEMEKVMQFNTLTSIAAPCSKPQIHAVEGEPLAKSEESKSKVLHSEFNENFSQFLKVDAVMQDKVTTEAAENDELEKEKDSKAKFTSQDL